MAARGLWIECICLMHEGSPYGHLKVNGKVIDDKTLARMVGGEAGEVKKLLAELTESGVASRGTDGCIISRRMVRDEEIRTARAAGGKQGGNPKLVGEYNVPGFVYAMQRDTDRFIKIGISNDPAKRLYKVRKQYPDAEIVIIAKLWVEDMGRVESELHKKFAVKKQGEWFDLDEGERGELLEFLLKVNGKAKPTPSSSSSSSSSSAGENTAPAPEIPTLEEAMSMTTNAAIPKEFVEMVYGKWSERQGKDGAGVVVDFLKHVTNRWKNEQVEWKNGTHKGRKGIAPPQSSGPTAKQVEVLAKEKCDDIAKALTLATAFHTYWSDPKRNWTEHGKPIDWKIKLSEYISKNR